MTEKTDGVTGHPEHREVPDRGAETNTGRMRSHNLVATLHEEEQLRHAIAKSAAKLWMGSTQIRRAVKTDKANWLTKQTAAVAKDLALGHTGSLWKLAKRLSGKQAGARAKPLAAHTLSDGQPVTTQQQEARMWQEKFLARVGGRGDIVSQHEADEQMAALIEAVAALIAGKALGPDQIPAEFLQAGGEGYIFRPTFMDVLAVPPRIPQQGPALVGPGPHSFSDKADFGAARIGTEPAAGKDRSRGKTSGATGPSVLAPPRHSRHGSQDHRPRIRGENGIGKFNYSSAGTGSLHEAQFQRASEGTSSRRLCAFPAFAPGRHMGADPFHPLAQHAGGLV